MGSATPYILRGRSPGAPQCFGSHLFVHTLPRRTTKFDVVTHMGRGLFLGQPRPPSQYSLDPADPNFGGLPWLCVYGLAQIKFGVVTHTGRCVFCGVSHCTNASRGLSATAEFLFSSNFIQFYEVLELECIQTAEMTLKVI